jgi:hypothetical protein
MTKAVLSCLMLLTVLAAAPAESVGGGQVAPPAIRPALLSLPMPDFTLPAVQGGDFGISKLKGKNVLLVFPRGKVADHWCQICHYQYSSSRSSNTVGLEETTWKSSSSAYDRRGRALGAIFRTRWP